MKSGLTVLAAMFALAMRAEESPIKSKEISADSSAHAVSTAEKQGTATATSDIHSGNFRILYYGKPWSEGKPLVDEATGYRVQIVGGDDVTRPFVAEVNAYNRTMREWHAKNASPAKKK